MLKKGPKYAIPCKKWKLLELLPVNIDVAIETLEANKEKNRVRTQCTKAIKKEEQRDKRNGNNKIMWKNKF